MKPINIICVDNLKEKYWKEAASEYQKRLQKYCELNIFEIKETDVENESAMLLNKINQNSKEFVILCDIFGQKFNSRQFSGLLNEKINQNSGITIIVGGSDGVNNEMKKRADLLVSFSDLTFPHQMFRVILLEQIYRAFKINKNEKYHK
ncbi:MAG: 23S rRNA (pseudouridine(1915)-N(3))-methyltransferase RlmH [Eubacteriaceae bacterium]|nr:23S rRNA (pseudouridine(1915)-N(3))-methyltransferase RlmH [Eubacteriaceae bacterium]